MSLARGPRRTSAWVPSQSLYWPVTAWRLHGRHIDPGVREPFDDLAPIASNYCVVMRLRDGL
jgi:hypothetical protein